MVVSLFAILLPQLHQQIAQLKSATILLCIRGMKQATTASFMNEANERASAVHVVGMPKRTLDESFNGPILDKRQTYGTNTKHISWSLSVFSSRLLSYASNAFIWWFFNRCFHLILAHWCAGKNREKNGSWVPLLRKTIRERKQTYSYTDTQPLEKQ